MLVGSVEMGQAGLGYFPKPCYDLARGKEKMVQDEIQAEVGEDQCSKMVGMSKQGAWTRWEHAESHKIIWAELWSSSRHRI